MATCAVAVAQADGTYLLRVDPTVIDVTTCSYVVQSGADIANSLLSLSAEDGGILAAGIVSVWVSAYAIRKIVDMLKGSTDEKG